MTNLGLMIESLVAVLLLLTIAFCIMLTAAVTLHTAGITNIESSAQAALALRPLAGEFAFTLFALGIIGEYLARMHFRSLQKPPYVVRLGDTNRKVESFRAGGSR